ncbi:MAG: aconitate hydratase [Pseudomonadota bacterium]
MGKSLIQKVIETHTVGGGAWEPGKEIALKIDQTLTQDATGTMAYLQFEAMGIPRVKTELSVSYVDHNTVQIGFENADDHRYLRTIAARYGLLYSRAGNGICHQVHLERFAAPGKTLLGSDSHTPTAGGVGSIAIGAGGLDVAVAMGGGPFHLTTPKPILIRLAGRLQPWVSAKDAILKVLELFGVKGNVGCAFEYGGEGVATLSVPERATITNMGAECGVTCSIFPSDDVTKRFLEAQGRGKDFVALAADADAAYAKVVDIDLSQLEPLAACPHSPGIIKPIRDLAGMKVHQVCAGSCTNSSYRDLMIMARALEGKRVAPGVSFVVAPGSRQVLQMITGNGALNTFLAAGARIAESACGFCIGNSQSPQSGAVSLRTSNRNFLGRSGTKDANVYLVSPESAAAAAISGRISDPREMGECPTISQPASFLIDDSMILPPSSEPNAVEIYRGPNIGTPPVNDPMPAAISGVVTIKVGDNTTTDHIIPAGARMKYRSNVPKYSEFVFEVLDPKFHVRAGEVKAKGGHNIIVGGLSYGQGSSREHAAICPMYLGVKAVLAKGFERIHSANLINFGILPLTFANEADYDTIDQGDELEIAETRATVERGGRLVVKNKTKGKEFEVNYSLTERQRDILLAGGTLSYMKTKA